MALARFFGQTVRSLMQVTEASRESLEQYVSNVMIGISFDAESLDHPNTLVTLEMSVNLLARLYPRIGWVYNRASTALTAVAARLQAIATAINPDIEVVEGGTNDVCLCVGREAPVSASPVFMASDGWNLWLDSKPIVTPSRTYNPLSAAAVACLGAAEMFKVVFRDALVPGKAQIPVTLSLLDYTKLQSDPAPLPLVNVGDLVLAGAGAVGNAAIWCLARLPGITGEISIVDDDAVDITNLQRYVLTDDESEAKAKTDIAQAALTRVVPVPRVFPVKFSSFVEKYRPDCNFDRIAVSVDNVEARREAQGVLPRVVFNAWTGAAGSLGASYHFFDSPDACLACLYAPTGKAPSLTDLVAEATGLDITTARKLVVQGTPLDDEVLSKIAGARRVDRALLEPWKGKTLTQLYREGVCGGAAMPLSGSGQETALVPLAHQSALAGVLLACEIVKECIGITPARTSGIMQLNILSAVPDYIKTPRGKTHEPPCICTDEVYVAEYHRKHRQIGPNDGAA